RSQEKKSDRDNSFHISIWTSVSAPDITDEIKPRESDQQSAGYIRGIVNTQINPRDGDQRNDINAYHPYSDARSALPEIRAHNRCKCSISSGRDENMTAWKRESREFHQIGNDRGSRPFDDSLDNLDRDLGARSCCNNPYCARTISRAPKNGKCKCQNQN